MKTMKIVLITLAVITSFVVLGQNPPTVGSITGTVRDPSGALIPGVTVSAFRAGAVASAVSDERGSYVISNIQPGTYTVSASLTGFQLEVSTVTVSANSSTRAEFKLR